MVIFFSLKSGPIRVLFVFNVSFTFNVLRTSLPGFFFGGFGNVATRFRIGVHLNGSNGIFIRTEGKMLYAIPRAPSEVEGTKIWLPCPVFFFFLYGLRSLRETRLDFTNGISRREIGDHCGHLDRKRPLEKRGWQSSQLTDNLRRNCPIHPSVRLMAN